MRKSDNFIADSLLSQSTKVALFNKLTPVVQKSENDDRKCQLVAINGDQYRELNRWNERAIAIFTGDKASGQFENPSTFSIDNRLIIVTILHVNFSGFGFGVVFATLIFFVLRHIKHQIIYPVWVSPEARFCFALPSQYGLP